jgi:hypothetical protein
MGLYNFKPQFVEPILKARKTHTIRAVRKHPDKPGDTMHLYTGLRRKGAWLIGRVECAKVETITIREESSIKFDDATGHLFAVKIDGQKLAADECEQLARRDGFSSFREMMDFWEGRLPFRGQIIHWRNPR